MVILKNGKTYQEMTCDKCNCEFGFIKRDIVDESRCEEYFGIWHSTIKEYVKCPQCNYKIYIKFEIDGESKI